MGRAVFDCMPGLVALSDSAGVTPTAQAKPESDDKRRHSKQSHVVPFGPARPALPMAEAPTAAACSLSLCDPVGRIMAKIFLMDTLSTEHWTISL